MINFWLSLLMNVKLNEFQIILKGTRFNNQVNIYKKKEPFDLKYISRINK